MRLARTTVNCTAGQPTPHRTHNGRRPVQASFDGDDAGAGTIMKAGRNASATVDASRRMAHHDGLADVGLDPSDSPRHRGNHHPAAQEGSSLIAHAAESATSLPTRPP